MQQEVDLNRYLKFFWRWLWLILVCAILAGGVSYAATRAMPRVYRASTAILVGEDTSKNKVSQEEVIVSLQVAATYSSLVRRQMILEGAVKALNLPIDWRELLDKVQAVHADGSATIEIRVTGNDAKMTAAIANEIAHQLVVQSPTAQDNQQLQERIDFVNSQLQTLQDNIARGEADIADKKSQLDDATSARSVLDLQDEIQALELKVTGWRSTYASLVNAKPTKSPNSITVVEAAYVPLTPISPNVPVTVLAGALAGLVLATATIGLIAFLTSDRLANSADTEQAYGLLSLGTLAAFGRVGRPSQALIAVRTPSSVAAEAYRRLRVSVQFAWGKPATPVILVTSPGVGEGKSVTSANLAASFAQAGKRTILMDADFRHPTLHELFEVPNTGGLAGLVWGGPLPVADTQEQHRATVASQLQRRARAFLVSTTVPNLRLLTAGDIGVTNPAELLSSPEMEEVLDVLRSEADVIVIDGSPVLPVADTALLASLGVGVVLVAEVGRTRASAIRQAVEILGQVQARVLGIALNRAALPRSHYSYPYTSTDQERPRQFGRLLRRV